VQDGVTNGAIIALLALALVFVFAVTRVIWVPSGEFVLYGAFTLAGLQLGTPPGTIGLFFSGFLLGLSFPQSQQLGREATGVLVDGVGMVRTQPNAIGDTPALGWRHLMIKAWTAACRRHDVGRLTDVVRGHRVVRWAQGGHPAIGVRASIVDPHCQFPLNVQQKVISVRSFHAGFGRSWTAANYEADRTSERAPLRLSSCFNVRADCPCSV